MLSFILAVGSPINLLLNNASEQFSFCFTGEVQTYLAVICSKAVEVLRRAGICEGTVHLLLPNHFTDLDVKKPEEI